MGTGASINTVSQTAQTDMNPLESAIAEAKEELSKLTLNRDIVKSPDDLEVNELRIKINATEIELNSCKDIVRSARKSFFVNPKGTLERAKDRENTVLVELAKSWALVSRIDPSRLRGGDFRASELKKIGFNNLGNERTEKKNAKNGNEITKMKVYESLNHINSLTQEEMKNFLLILEEEFFGKGKVIDKTIQYTLFSLKYLGISIKIL
jgi:hypothetical protein